MSNLILGTSNSDYHADTTHVSSSGLKLLLSDPAAFHAKYVARTAPPEPERDVFTEGSLVHTLILEPDKFQAEYAVYPGLRRQGKVYEDFLTANPGRKVVTAAMAIRAQTLATKHRAHKAAVHLNDGGLAEQNMVGMLLGSLPVKARCDLIQPDRKYISDVKTTSQPSGIEFFKTTVQQFDYDLSAALYCMIAEQTYGVRFDFYWEVLSKSDQGLEIYKMSEATRATGMAKVVKAANLYVLCAATNVWELPKEQRVDNVDTDNYEILEV